MCIEDTTSITISAPYNFLLRQTPECRWRAYPTSWVTTWNKRTWKKKSRRTRFKNIWWLLILTYSMQQRLSRMCRLLHQHLHLKQWSNNHRMGIRNINPSRMFSNKMKVDSLLADFLKWLLKHFPKLLLWLLMLILRIIPSNKMNHSTSQTSKDWNSRPKPMTLIQPN